MTENILTVIKDKVIAAPQPAVPAPIVISPAAKFKCAAAVFTAAVTICTIIAVEYEKQSA